jgi:hypothetical protein
VIKQGARIEKEYQPSGYNKNSPDASVIGRVFVLVRWLVFYPVRWVGLDAAHFASWSAALTSFSHQNVHRLAQLDSFCPGNHSLGDETVLDRQTIQRRLEQGALVAAIGVHDV